MEVLSVSFCRMFNGALELMTTHQKTMLPPNRVIWRYVSYFDQSRFGLGQFAGSEVGPGEILEDFDVGILEELLEAIFVHLNGGDHLFLLHIDVGDVEPNVAEISRRLANLGEDVASLRHVSFVKMRFREDDILKHTLFDISIPSKLTKI